MEGSRSVTSIDCTTGIFAGGLVGAALPAGCIGMRPCRLSLSKAAGYGAQPTQIYRLVMGYTLSSYLAAASRCYQYDLLQTDRCKLILEGYYAFVAVFSRALLQRSGAPCGVGRRATPPARRCALGTRKVICEVGGMVGTHASQVDESTCAVDSLLQHSRISRRL